MYIMMSLCLSLTTNPKGNNKHPACVIRKQQWQDERLEWKEDRAFLLPKEIDMKWEWALEGDHVQMGKHVQYNASPAKFLLIIKLLTRIESWGWTSFWRKKDCLESRNLCFAIFFHSTVIIPL